MAWLSIGKHRVNPPREQLRGGAEPQAPSSLAAKGHHGDATLRPSDSASFFLLGDRSVVFCERTQKIYELNQTAAYIWCRLEEYAPLETICSELARSGIDPGLARRHVRNALRNWLKLGLIEAGHDFDPDAVAFARSFNLRIADFDMTIRVTSERLGHLFSVFDHLVAPAHESAHTLAMIEADGLVHVFHNRLSVMCCDEAELVPSIKAYVTEQLVRASAPNIVFHAACLIRGDRSILISGRPGAGKTTLALRLVETGFSFAADDIVLIAPDGSATGVPFAPAVKSGAWDTVKDFRPDVTDAITHRRTDGKRVRYLPPKRIARHASYPVGTIVFLKRALDVTELRPLDPVKAMRKVMEASYAMDGKLSLAGCRTLNRMLTNASSFELTTSTLSETAAAIAQLCDG